MINDSDNSVTAGARGARARRGAQRPAADLAHLSISNSLSSRHGELDHVPAVGETQRTLFISARAALWPLATVNGV